MTSIPTRSPGKSHATVDGNLKRCRVLRINPTAKTATLIDRFGTIFDVALQYISGGGYPAEGDHWIMSNPFGRWCFLYKENPDPPPLQYGQIVFTQQGTLTSHVGADLPPWTSNSQFVTTLFGGVVSLNGAPNQPVTVLIFTEDDGSGTNRIQIATITVAAGNPLAYTFGLNGIIVPYQGRVLGQVSASTGNAKDLTIQIDYSFDTTVSAI